MDRRFTGRTAIVTGAARGIGAATATRLAREGAAVVIVDLDEAAAAEQAALVAADAEVRAAGGAAEAAVADMTDADAVERLVDRIAAAHGGIHVLVNNAGATRDDLIHRMTPESWRLVLETNLTTAFAGIRAVQRHMVPARTGSVVNLSSRSALGNRGQANYAAAKAGIQALTATAALELGPFGIRVNAVAPGYIATAMTAASAERLGLTPEEHQAMVAERTPLARVGRAEEVAAAIAFLASDDASYVSGQTLHINGGAR